MASDLTRGDALCAFTGVPDGTAHSAAVFVADRALAVTADRPAAKTWAAEMLEAVGLIPTVHEAHTWNTTSTAPRAARYGHCRVCGRKKSIRVSGVIGEHRLHGDYYCTGGGLPPKEDA